jgi:hypothetical protein
MVTKLNLTRDQLATFLKNYEQIKQFENLFAVADAIAPDVVNEVSTAAGSAQATAVQAVGMALQFAQDAAVCCAAAEARAQDALDRVSVLEQDSATKIAVAEALSNQALTLVESLRGDVEGLSNQAMTLVASLRGEVEGLQAAPPEREYKRSRYGSFYDTTTQSAAIINTATAITFNTTDLSNGVFLGTPTSRVYVDTGGIYNFQTSIQLDSTVATAEEFYLWFRLNGVDVTNSASQVRVQGNNAEVFVSLNYFFNLKAGDYVELMFSVSNLGVQLLAAGAVAPHPGIPSIILTVANNIEGIQ